MSRRKFPLTPEQTDDVGSLMHRAKNQSNFLFLKRIWTKGYFTKGERKRLNILVEAFNKQIERNINE